MTHDDSFDERLFETYAPTGGERIIPRMSEDQIGKLFPVIYNKALDHSRERTGATAPQLQEIISRTNFWAATVTYIRSFQDERWDVSRQLPLTDVYHSDLAVAYSVNNLSDMFTGYQRIIDDSDSTIDPKEYATLLQELSKDGVLIDSPIVRILLALGVKYGASAIGPNFDEIVLGNLSKREQLRLTSTDQMVGDALYEDARLHGSTPPTSDDLATFYEGVAGILQFETTAVTLNTLGIISKVSPTLQNFALRFYKQHKTMLFSETPLRTSQATSKLVQLLAVFESDTKNDDMSRESASYAAEYISGRLSFNDAIMNLERQIFLRIVSGSYEADTV